MFFTKMLAMLLYFTTISIGILADYQPSSSYKFSFYNGKNFGGKKFDKINN